MSHVSEKTKKIFNESLLWNPWDYPWDPFPLTRKYRKIELMIAIQELRMQFQEAAFVHNGVEIFASVAAVSAYSDIRKELRELQARQK